MLTKSFLSEQSFRFTKCFIWKSSVQYHTDESEVPQSCPTLCNPMDSSLPCSSIHGILQARILEWVAISFSSRSAWPRDWTWVSCTAGRFFTIWTTREAHHTDIRQLIEICWIFTSWQLISYFRYYFYKRNEQATQYMSENLKIKFAYVIPCDLSLIILLVF